MQKLSAGTSAALKARDVQENLAKQGATPSSAGPAELAAQIVEETQRWASIVRDAGIKTE